MNIISGPVLYRVTVTPGEENDWPDFEGARGMLVRPDQVTAEFLVVNGVLKPSHVGVRGCRILKNGADQSSQRSFGYDGDFIPSELNGLILDIAVIVAGKMHEDI
jgi:hypothetical protein